MQSDTRGRLINPKIVDIFTDSFVYCTDHIFVCWILFYSQLFYIFGVSKESDHLTLQITNEF